MSYDHNNIFAKILRNEIPCNKIYEDEFVLAFYDIKPFAPETSEDYKICDIVILKSWIQEKYNI